MDNLAQSYLEGLNEEQLQAVTAADGPFLIIAGAGTGKTMALTRRIAWLIAVGKAKPEEILALTFTDKAAGEMTERVDKLLPYGYVDLQISTFHSFCEKILKEHGLTIGLPHDFRLLNETDAYLLVRRNFPRFLLDYYRPRTNPTKFIHALLKHFSRLKDEAVMPEEYLKLANELVGKATDDESREAAAQYLELANAYSVYQTILLENDALDFGDLQMYAIELLRKRPSVRGELSRRFRYVLVDEFQDTNWAQYELVKLLVPGDGNLMVVGDDDQSIYKFRGASVSNIMQFKDDFPSAKEVVLTRNYRSLQEILDASYAFIKQNDPNRLEAKLFGPDGKGICKRLVSDRGRDGKIIPMRHDTLEEEAEDVAKKIIELRNTNPELTWSDFCILSRSNSGAEDYVLALERLDVPYQFLALKGLYTKPVIMDVLAYLRLLDDYRESTAMYRTLNSPPYRIDAGDLLAITHESRKRARSIFDVCNDLGGLTISEQTRETLGRLLSDVARHSQLARLKTTEEVLVAYLFDSGYLRQLTSVDNADTRADLGYLSQFRKRVRRFEKQGDERSLRHFMEEFEIERESGEQGGLDFDPEVGPDMVRVMTVHGAKGLEFRHVFIVGLVDKRFPSIARGGDIDVPEELTKENVPEGDMHLEEERRLMYVAMTRARDGLYLTWADDYGGKTKKKPSRFLMELGFVSSDEFASKKRVKKSEAFEEPKERVPGPPPPFAMPSHYSFSQLEAFSTCPLQYKYAHILRIPTFGRAATSFGNTMHKTLQDFFEEIARRNKDGNESGDLPVSVDELLALYDANWIDDWYPSREEKEDYREMGRRALRRIWDETQLNKPRVMFLEKEFMLKIGERLLRGKIDRIDERPDGTVEIIDYKSATPKKDEQIKFDNKRQLIIYQMAVKQCLGLEVSQLSFYYLQDSSKVSFLGTDKEIEKVQARAEEQISAIEAGDFTATPSQHCRYCDFRHICPKSE